MKRRKKSSSTKSRLPKLPKPPKAKASLKVWKAYAKKVKEHQAVIAEIRAARKILCSPSFAFPDAPTRPAAKRSGNKLSHARILKKMNLTEFRPRRKKRKGPGVYPRHTVGKTSVTASMYGGPRDWYRKMLAAKKRKASARKRAALLGYR